MLKNFAHSFQLFVNIVQSKSLNINHIYTTLNHPYIMHVNSTVEEKESVTKKKASLGVRLFFVYSICYAGFIILGVFHYQLLATTMFAGLNLAVVYGMGLIIFAFVLGIIYNYYCTRYEDEAELEDAHN